MATQPAAAPGEKTTRNKRRGWLKWIAIGALLVVLILIALGPTIAAPLARPLIQDAANDQIKGHVEIDALDLSWFGAQEAALTLDDPDGREVADVAVRAETGLLGLALGSRDLGLVYLTGKADIVREADGRTNLLRAIEPRRPRPTPQEPAEPAQLPDNLEASLVLEGLDVTYRDAALAQQTGGQIEAVHLGSLRGSVDFAVGSPLTLEIRGPISTGLGEAFTEAGSIEVEANVTNLTDASGTLTPDALGGEVALAIDAPGVRGSLQAAMTDRVLTAGGESRVTIDLAEFASLIPSLAQALGAQPGVEITKLPTLALAVDSLRVPLDDLSQAAAALRLQTSEVEGSVRIEEDARPFAIEPLALALETPSLGETVTLRGGTSARIDGESAGELSVDLTVGGLLDEAGEFRKAMPGTLAGDLRITDFSTAILQPFVGALNLTLGPSAQLDLPADLGPELDASVAARSGGPGAYEVDLTLAAEHADVAADLAVSESGKQISSRGRGIHASFDSLASMAERALSLYGVTVEGGAGLTVDAADVEIDLARVTAPEGPDLRGARGRLSAAVSATSGTVIVPGHGEPVPFRLERLTMALATDDAGDDVSLTTDAGLTIDGEPAANVRTDMTLSGLLGPSGAPRLDSLPMLRGEARLEAAQTATLDKLLAPWLEGTGVELTKDLGERAELLALAASDPEAGANATSLDITLRSRHIDVTAPLTVTPERLSTREPLIIVDRAAGSTLSRVMGEAGPAAFGPTGAARLAIADMVVPVEPGWKIRPDRIRAGVTATLTDFALLLDPAALTAAGEGAAGGSSQARPSAPGGQRQRIAVPRLVATASAAPGEAPSVTMEGQFAHDDARFTAAANATLHGLFVDRPATPDNPLSALDPTGVRPEGRLALTGLPATLARLVPPSLLTVGEQRLDAVLLARDTLGRTVDIELTSAPVADDPRITEAALALRSEGTTTSALLRFARGTHVRLFEAAAEVRVTERVAEHLARTLAPELAARPDLVVPARLSLALQRPVTIPLSSGFTPDFSRADQVLALRAGLDASLAAITLPAEEGAEPLTVPPVTIEGLVIDAAAPLTVLAERGGEAQATIAGRLLQADGSPLAALSGEARAALASGKPAGPMPVSIALTNVAGKWIDEMLGRPALVAGALGDRFALSLAANPALLDGSDPSKEAISLSIDAPRFKTQAPIGVAFNPTAAYITQPLRATWTIGPAWGNHYLFGREAGGPPPALTLTEPTQTNIRVQRLALAVSEGAGPLKPGVFLIDATVTLPQFAAQMSDGGALRLSDVEFKLGRGPTPEQIGFALTVPRIKVGDQPEFTPEDRRITGRLASFTDETGAPTPDAARLYLSGGLGPIPTDLVDALAHQGGLLRDALGPTINLTIDADALSMQGGTLRATAVSPLARADVRGRVTDGLFIVDPASVVEVSRITPDLTRRFQKAIPVIATLEKTEQDQPARLTFQTPVAVPLDGTFDRLTGEMTFDIGTARYSTGDIFQKVLAVAQQRSAGEVGRRLPPLHVTMADGLVTYDRFSVPFGEFTLETQGAINLSSVPRQIRPGAPGENQLGPRRLEVLTFIPSGAFVAEAVPGIANLPVPVVGQLARLPIRTHGPIGDPTNDVAAELVGREAVNELVQPGRLLDDRARNLLKDLLGGGGDR